MNYSQGELVQQPATTTTSTAQQPAAKKYNAPQLKYPWLLPVH